MSDDALMFHCAMLYLDKPELVAEANEETLG